MYCLKCRSVTDSINLQERVSKNNRKMLTGLCKVCGTKKSKFVNQNYKLGQGLLNGELHLPTRNGEHVPNGSFNNQNNYSYCGPGTKYTQRNREGYKGINELDKMCKLHDQFYTENTDTDNRNISDEALAHRAYEISNDPKYDSTQRNMSKLVYYIMKNKARFGLGHSKNVKRGPMQKK